MTPSARTHTGHMQILFGGSAAFGTRGQHAVDFPHIQVLKEFYLLEEDIPMIVKNFAT